MGVARDGARWDGPHEPEPVSRRWQAQLGLNAFASAVATALDYGLVVLLVEGAGASPVAATALGALFGAIVNFTLNRTVTFRSRSARLPQMGRYAVVSLGTLVLNTAGVAVLVGIASYVWAWWVVRAAVYLLFSFPMQRSFVFGDRERA